jgi:quinol-cytochrome oxidoreductase complex cytochrome b subunit
VKFADADLQESLDRPVPWRRVYGFALNSNLLDRGFLFGSIAVLVVWGLVPDSSGRFVNLEILRATPVGVYARWLFGLFAVGMLFFAGEMDRRDKVRPIIGKLKAIKVPLFFIGVILLGVWIYLYRGSFSSNAVDALSQPYQIIAMVILIPVIAYMLVRMQTKGGTQPATI